MGNKPLSSIIGDFRSFFYVLLKRCKRTLPIAFSLLNKIKHILNTNQELKKRILYGIAFAFVVLFVVLCGGVVYITSVFVITLIMMTELLKIASNIEQQNNKMFVCIRRWGLAYIISCCLSLILIREIIQGFKISLWMYLTVWAVDCFAYVFGKKFGNIKLAKDISPNKTYEGAILGSITGLFASIIIYKIFKTDNVHGFSLVSFVIFSIIVIILAQLSDLSESLIKRQCGVKDSGTILSAHGGLLDRFDSFLIVAPFICIIVWLNGGVLF